MSAGVVSRVSIAICIPSHVTSGEVTAGPANTIRHIYQSWDKGEQDIYFFSSSFFLSKGLVGVFFQDQHNHNKDDQHKDIKKNGFIIVFFFFS